MNIDFRKRIQITQSSLKDAEVLLLFASDFKMRNSDVEYKFRQNSDYFFHTGIEEADGILVLKKDWSAHFALPKDKEKEIWTGIRLGKDLIKEKLGLNESFDLSEWDAKKEEILTNVLTLFHFFGQNADRDRELLTLCSSLNRKLREGKFGPKKIEIPEFLHERRLIKAPEEIEILKRAVQITKKGHERIMKICRPGIPEYELEAALEEEYLKGGAWGGGYGHIVAGGKNATVLHYNTNRDILKDNDVVLVDSGAEVDYYTADVTRVFPVGKKFSAAQSEIYSLVLDVQKKAISMTVEENTVQGIHQETVRNLTAGLISLKLLSGSVDENIENANYKKFYMHRTGHWLGMDVHDAGSYYVNGNPRPLQNGMITTVEPGLYFDPNDESIPSAYRGIGVRIEDNILVSGKNPINLTESIVKEISEIEALRNM